MNGNYEWQKFAAQNKTAGYRQQAEAQRQLKDSKVIKGDKRPLSFRAGLIVLAGVVIIVVGFLLSGCQVDNVPVASANAPNASESSRGMSLQDRHYFHDQLVENAESLRVSSKSNNSPQGWSMADKIRLQDERDAIYGMVGEKSTATTTDSLSLAERQQFHDRLGK